MFSLDSRGEARKRTDLKGRGPTRTKIKINHRPSSTTHPTMSSVHRSMAMFENFKFARCAVHLFSNALKLNTITILASYLFEIRSLKFVQWANIDLHNFNASLPPSSLKINIEYRHDNVFVNAF